jgi:hypothetical protein
MKERVKFWSPYEQHKDRIGLKFKIIRELTDKERDPEVGKMYRIWFYKDGVEIDAWPEEIFHNIIIGGMKQYKREAK